MTTGPKRALACVLAIIVAALQSSDCVAHSPANRHASAVEVGLTSDLAGSLLEARLLNDARDGRWDEHTLFTAAEIASGVATEAELLAAKLDYAELVRDLRARLLASSSADDRACEILAFLHQGPLSGGYDLAATTLPEVFQSRRFNCVSATVLFNSLAADVGLEVGAVRLPQHTCSMLLEGERAVRVEPTSPRWFETQPRTGNTRPLDSLSRMSADGDDDIEPISDVALVAMIYYNRGVEALRRKELVQAITLNRMALSLDPQNRDARGNLLSAMNKRALELAARRDFAAAVALVEQGLAIDPSHQPLQLNREYIDRVRK